MLSPAKLPRLYRRLPQIILVLTVATLLSALGILYILENELLTRTGHSLALLASDIASELDQVFYDRYADLSLASDTLQPPLPQAEVSRYLQRMNGYYRIYQWLGVTDSHGRVVAATEPRSLGLDLHTATWFQVVSTPGAPPTVHVSEDVTGQTRTVSFSSAIIGRRGEFRGVVTGQVGLSALEEIVTRMVAWYSHQHNDRVVEWQLLTRDGVVIVDSLLHEQGINLQQMGLPSALVASQGAPGFVRELHARRRVPVITGYAHIMGSGAFSRIGWGILVRLDEKAVLAPIRRQVLTIGAAGGLVWLPMFGLLLWTTKQLRVEWRRAQERGEALKESQRAMATLISNLPGMVYRGEETGVLTFVSDGCLSVTGLAPDESQQRYRALIHPDDRDRVIRTIEQAARAQAAYEVTYRLQTPGGEEKWVWELGRGLLAEADGRPRIEGFITEITAQKQAEQRLWAQYAITRTLAEAATPEQAASEILQTLCQIGGWDVGVFWCLDRQIQALRMLSVFTASRAASSQADAWVPRRSYGLGEGLPGQVWAKAIPIWDTENAAFPVHWGEHVLGVLQFFGQKPVSQTGALLEMMSAIGSQIGHYLERQQLEAQFRQAQKMEAIGQLAAGIAHDFNNVLMAILGNIQLMQRYLPAEHSLVRYAKEIETAATRAADLVRQLLAFSRQQVLEPRLVALNEIICSMESLLRRLIGEDITLVTKLDPEAGQVYADPGQLEQVILNLAVNARDAMPKGGQLSIETARLELDQTAALDDDIAPGSYAVLLVTDTGTGIAPEIQRRIFDPFFTTKPIGQGTGLGLSIVYGIVKQSGGSVRVQSQIGIGTVFRILLPRVYHAQASEPELFPLPTHTSGTETILVVEDDEQIRRLICQALAQAGYSVLEASHGAEALSHSRGCPDPVHLLITDLVLPHQSGAALAEQLRLERPGLKVLYLSATRIMEPGMPFLRKPFSLEALLMTVRRVLDQPGPDTLEIERVDLESSDQGAL